LDRANHFAFAVGITALFAASCGSSPTASVPFPQGFLWGVSTAAQQSEGKNTQNDWYAWEMLGKVPTVGLADDSYDLYDTDATEAQGLGANEFRLTFEWARIVPNAPADPTAPLTTADVDMTEVAHYQAVIASLKAHGLTPVVTLTHYTLPLWVDNPAAYDAGTETYTDGSLGAWTNPVTAQAFASYAGFMAQTFGGDVKYWLTENEPLPDILSGYLFEQWPPGFLRVNLTQKNLPNGASVQTALINMIDGHARAYKAIKAAEPDAKVSFAHNSIATLPIDPNNPADVAAAARWDHFYNLLFLDAVTTGMLDTSLTGAGPMQSHPEWAGTLDYLAVNYYAYDPVVPTCGLPGPVDALPCDPLVEAGLPGVLQNLGCPAENPSEVDGLKIILSEYENRYHLPILITENGSGQMDSTQKAAYIVQNLAELGRLAQGGMPIIGYSYWTLNRDYEWTMGFNQWFGLYDVQGFEQPGFAVPGPTTDFTRVPMHPATDVFTTITKGNAVPGSLIDQYK
jgi:beta-glucosidase/6-phospho-beta-glucosidase/beta-galactosidase